MRLLKDEKGNVTILVTVVLFALMGIMALVIDMGVVYAQKVELANAIDAALLAGGQELPSDIEEAKNVMEEYLIANGVALDEVTITIEADGLSANIVAIKSVPHHFAKVIGFDASDINEQAKLILGSASSAAGGIRPFGLEKFDFEYGDPVVLKEGAGNGYHGNYGAIALGSSGSSTLLSNALYGYDGVVKVGDFINTEPGNMAGMVSRLSCYLNSIEGTFDDYSSDSDRVWTIPVFDTLDVDGRESIEVVGFAQFFVERATKTAGQAEIHGRFIEYVTNGDIDPTLESTGVYGMKLVD